MIKVSLKIIATVALYGALSIVALNAASQLDLPSVSNFVAMCLFTGAIHAALWG